MKTIQKIQARQIIDSRGNPTLEVDVILSNGILGRAAVPSGASTGDKEAMELRDGNKAYLGKTVYGAIENIHTFILPVIQGIDPTNYTNIDQILIDLDGTQNKTNLGANTILGVSLASARAAANAQGVQFFEFINKNDFHILPVPMMNILNGGGHADNNIDFQEFMIYPLGANSFSESLQIGVEIFQHLKQTLKKRGLNTSVGDEGGFAPNLSSNEEAIEVILEAVEKSGYKIGKEAFIALDVASSEFYNKDENLYVLESENRKLNSLELIDYYKSLIDKYPIVSIEDGLDQNDWDGWILMNQQLGNSIQIVGDDLTVTNPNILQEAIDKKAINAILIKLNQIGTLSETLDTINLAKENNLGTIISHRSGETEDTIIADFSVATNAGQIKTGSASRTDRTAKYNQLLRIEEKIGENSKFAGPDILKLINT